jgi:uncharacterized membrane protein YphA (DoxX/SURF4 family)
VHTAASILAGVLGAIFVVSGGTKLAGMQMHRDHFEHWRYPEWFRVFTGAWEGAGGVLAVVGIWSHPIGLVGAALIAAAMVGAVYTHTLRVRELKALPAPAFLLLLAIATGLTALASL